MFQSRFWLILSILGTGLFAGSQTFASQYTGYDCNALNPSSSWNCPCGCSYSSYPSPTPPENCEANFTSTSSSTVGGPHNECQVTTYQNTTNYDCQFEFFPSEYSSYTTYNCKLTAADCSPGETFLPYVCGCIAGAPSCVAPGSTPAPITTVSSSEGGTDSGCQRRWKQITQRIQPGFIPGDKYSYFSATVVASTSDSTTTIATKMAAAINSYATKLGVWYSVGFSASSSGDTITIKEPWQAGLNQVSSYRPHPVCTPTPSPTAAMSVPTPTPTATAAPTATPAPSPSQTCSGAVDGAASPCACAANATGTLSGNNLTCSCNSGFHISGSSCVQDPCSGPGAALDGLGQCTCSGSNVNTTPSSGVCSCNAGYHTSGSACVQDPCSGPGSALNGSGVCTCSGTNVNPVPTSGVCGCNAGSYDNGSGQCVIDTCSGVGAALNGSGQCTCAANATATGSGTAKTCSCNPGFNPDGTGANCVAAPTCVYPEQDDGSGGCAFLPNNHACNVGSGTVPTSAVSNEIGGLDAATRFNNTINKKLACCLNYQNTGDSYAKFDCIENAKTFYADFNALWTSADTAARGGQLNAIVLAGSSGKPMTGFYTTTGQRCAEFSEFSSAAIQPGKVDAEIQTGQSNRTGQASGFDAQGKAPLSKPAAAMYSTMASKINKSVPTSTADRRRCPILVRAAVLASCPSNPQVPGATKRSYEESDKIRRCAVASSVQVQVRVEQVWEIAGQAPVKPIDTVLDPMAASSISVEKIIANKYGSSCPPGTTKQGDTCVY